LLAGKTTITAMKRRVDQAANRSHIRDLRALVNERIPQNHALKGTASTDRATANGPVDGSANSQFTTGQFTGGQIIHSRITRSRAEQRIKRVVLSLDVPTPQFNYRIRTIDGGFIELDLAWPEFRVGLDIDGYRWHGGRFNWKRDLQRDHQITVSGWNVKHVIPEITDSDLLALISALLNSSMG
jgi:very-short-patch-repair endonuclease